MSELQEDNVIYRSRESNAKHRSKILENGNQLKNYCYSNAGKHKGKSKC